MDIPLLYQYDIIRLQIIRTSFDHVIDLSAYEDSDLVKIMIMVFDLVGFLVCQMKQPEFAV